MQTQTKAMIQDEVNDTSNDDDAHKHSKHITIDISEITSRYQDVCPLGCGANALIFSAIDQQCQRRLAVKKVALKQCTSPVVLKRLFREIRVLRQLDHDNVLRIYHTLVSTRGRNSAPISIPDQADSASQLPIDAVYIGLELMDTDLQNVLMQEQLNFQYAKLFSYQLLRGLKYIHSANVIHRDLTPSNIFINMDTLMLKIGDFGVCRIFDDDYNHCGHLSMVSSATRYQAPELVLHPRHYDKAVDVWAVGCIIAEMLIGKPLFKIECSYDLIDSILNTLPVTSQAWSSVAGVRCQDEKCCPNPQSYGQKENGGFPKLPLCKRFPQLPLAAIDFLSALLTFDPHDRSSAHSALGHVFMKEYANEQDEPGSSAPFQIEDELDDISYAKYQHVLRREASKSVSLCTSEGSNDQNSFVSHAGSKASICETDSYKNLIALVHSNNQSTSSNHSGGMTESEARTIACDLDYGVQITDGSVNRERLCMDFHPLQSAAACFDPYKWDHQSTENEKEKAKAVVKDNADRHHSASHSDHGYHSSYCSSNISHGRNPNQSMWSLSSPDISIDHDNKFGGNHRASTPDMGESYASNGYTETDGCHPEVPYSPHQSTEDSEYSDTKRRHKEDAVRHHHSYYHHHYHHHHHHHHHHKHHRHSSRHGSSQTQQKNATEMDTLMPSSGRFERRCVVNDVVPEVVEESLVVSGKASGQNEAKGNKTRNVEERSPPELCEEQGALDVKISEAPDQRSDSEYEDFNAADVVIVSDDASVLKQQPVQFEAFVQNGKFRHETFSEGKHRNRTFSDGSQLEDRHNIATALQRTLNRLCLGSLFKDTQTQYNCGLLNNCQSVIKRIRTFSSDCPLLSSITVQADQPCHQKMSFVPPKCSTDPLRSATLPRRQVECPF